MDNAYATHQRNALAKSVRFLPLEVLCRLLLLLLLLLLFSEDCTCSPKRELLKRPSAAMGGGMIE
jgi:hypothetical protein